MSWNNFEENPFAENNQNSNLSQATPLVNGNSISQTPQWLIDSQNVKNISEQSPNLSTNKIAGDPLESSNNS
jgi:hypothetical protein